MLSNSDYLRAFSFWYYSSFFFCNFNFSFNFFIFYISILFYSGTDSFFSNIFCKSVNFAAKISFSSCSFLNNSSLFLSSSYKAKLFSLLSSTRYTILYPASFEEGGRLIGIFPSNIIFNIFIYSDISLNIASFGSSFIFGLFLINLALLA